MAQVEMICGPSRMVSLMSSRGGRRAGARARGASHRLGEVDQRRRREALTNVCAPCFTLPLGPLAAGPRRSPPAVATRATRRRTTATRQLTVLAAASLTDVFAELGDGVRGRARRRRGDLQPRHQHRPRRAGRRRGPGRRARHGRRDLDGDRRRCRRHRRRGRASPTNVLVIVDPAGNPAGIESLDDLGGVTWVRCADEVPCGRVAVARPRRRRRPPSP